MHPLLYPGMFNSMRNNLLDELIADYRGIVAAIGHYRADGRIHNYQGQTARSARAFVVLQALVKAAAENLEYFARYFRSQLPEARNLPLMLIALARLTMEELASDEAFERLQKNYQQLQNESPLLNTQLASTKS